MEWLECVFTVHQEQNQEDLPDLEDLSLVVAFLCLPLVVAFLPLVVAFLQGVAFLSFLRVEAFHQVGLAYEGAYLFRQVGAFHVRPLVVAFLVVEVHDLACEGASLFHLQEAFLPVGAFLRVGAFLPVVEAFLVLLVGASPVEAFLFPLVEASLLVVEVLLFLLVGAYPLALAFPVLVSP